jgi:predicted DNA-binding transcriptional regulator AlpA
MWCGGLSEIAQPWHIHSSLTGPNPFQLVRTEAIPWQVIPVASCRRTVMMKGSAEVASPLLTEKQASAYLSRSVSTLRRGRKNGTGPKFVRIGRSIRYLKSELDGYIFACGTILGPSGVKGA